MKHNQPTDSPQAEDSYNKPKQFEYAQLIVVLVLAAAIGFSAYVHLTGPVLPFDDAFITYRYVKNLLAGQGLVYNLDHRVMGFSSPLHLLLLALLKIVFSSVELPVLAVRFNMLPHALTGVAVYLLLKRFTANRWFALAGGTLILVERHLLAWSLGGMESFIFAGLMLFGLLAALDKKPLRLGVLTALACLTRPEGVLLLPISLIMLFPFRSGLLKLVKVGASFALTILPWILFAWLYYGNPVPLSVLAKAKPLYPLPPLTSLGQLTWRFQEWFLPGLPWLNTLHLLLLVFGLILVSLIGAIVHRNCRQAGGWLAAVLFLEFAAIYGRGNPMLFDWYLPVIFVCGAIAIMTGLSAWGYLLGNALARITPPALARVCPIVFFAATLAWLVPGTVKGYAEDDTPASMVSGDPSRLRIEGYRQAAKALSPYCSDATRIAAPEIGSFGYYCKGYILDACGLVSPEALEFLPVPDDQRLNYLVGAISTDFVRETKPDYVVTMPIFACRSLLPVPPAESTWFTRNYVQIAFVTLPKPCWGSKHVLIFRKK